MVSGGIGDSDGALMYFVEFEHYRGIVSRSWEYFFFHGDFGRGSILPVAA